MDSDDGVESFLSIRGVGMPDDNSQLSHLSASDEELDALIYEALTGVEEENKKEGANCGGHNIAAKGAGRRSKERPGLSLCAGEADAAQVAQQTPSLKSEAFNAESKLPFQFVLDAGHGFSENDRSSTHIFLPAESDPADLSQETEDALAVNRTSEEHEGKLADEIKKEQKEEQIVVETLTKIVDYKRPCVQFEGPEIMQAHELVKQEQRSIQQFSFLSDARKAADQLTGAGAPTGFQDLDDEKQILDAILNAVNERQSSVSGDLLCDEDDSNVDAVLRHAESIAASSLQERKKKSKINRVMHFHENIELRSVLRNAREAVGWPSCICARAAAVVIEVSPQKDLDLLPSSTLAKRPAICIGTTLGVLLLLDAKRKLCGMCGFAASTLAESRGAVVSLSMSFDASTVISGHEIGGLVLWDVDTLTALRQITGQFTTPIVCLRHCNVDPFRAILLRGSGSVELISFTRIMSKTVYRLTNIAVSLAEVPFNDIDVAFSKEKESYLIAAISAETLLVYALKSSLQGVAVPFFRRKSFSKSAKTNEFVRFVSVYMENRVCLCAAWGVNFEIFSVATCGVITQVQQIAVVHLKRPLHAMTPIVDCCLLLLDQSDSLHLLDASAAVIVETRVLNDIDPVVFVGQTCGTRYNSAVASTGSDALLLGRHRIFTCSLLSWRARLDALVEQRRFSDALELAKAFALEVALAVVGLHGDLAIRRACIREYLIYLITAYLTHVINTHPSQDTSGYYDYFVENIQCIINFSASVDALDVFFGPAMELLRKNDDTYMLALYSLEECILSGAVTSLPEMYVQPFFNLFAKDGKMLPAFFSKLTKEANNRQSLSGVLRAERALMRLENSYELLLRIAEEHNLLRLVVAILSYRQYKYVDAFRVALEKGNNNDSIALLLFECTMKGYTVLEDVELAEEQSCRAKKQLWNHLLTVTDDFKALFYIDPERTLRVSLLSLEENGPDSPWPDMSLKLSCVTQLFLLIVGIELSSRTMLRPWKLAKRQWPDYAVVHTLFTGTLRLVVSGAVVLSDQLQVFCEHACSHFIYQFQISENAAQRRHIQSELAVLFTSAVTKDVDFVFVNEELRQEQMARALAALYCSRREYVKAIDCYLEKESNRADMGLSKDVFVMIYEEMNRALSLGDEEAAQRLRKAVLQRISLLVDVDATSLTQFVSEHLSENYEDIMNMFRNHSETFFCYLDELVARNDVRMASDVKLQNTYIELLCAHDPTRVYSYLHSHDSIIAYDLCHALTVVRKHNISDASVFLLEKALMIDEALDVLLSSVIDKLRKLRSEVLKHVAFSTTNEKKNMFFFSPSILCSPVTCAERNEQINTFGTINTTAIKAEVNKKHEDQQCSGHCWAAEGPLLHVLDMGIDLCTKYHAEFEIQFGENWFCLLELFTFPRRLLCERQTQHNAALQSAFDNTVDGFEDDEIQASLVCRRKASAFSGAFPFLSCSLSARGARFLEHMISLYTKYVSYILTHMIQVMDPLCVISRIAKDYERERFGPFKPVIVDVMSLLEFELETNRLCKIAIDEDLIELHHKLYRGLNTGVVLFSNICCICEKVLSNARNAGERGGAYARIYTCGHGYHEACAKKFDHAFEDCVQCCKERGDDINNLPVSDSQSRSVHGFNKGVRRWSGNFRGCVENDKGGETENCEEQEEVREKSEACLSRTIRRLRHTRAKIDRTRCHGDILRSLIGSNDTHVSSLEILKEFLPGRPLLAPAPQPPINIGEFSAETLELDKNFTVTLTDEEILELFDACVNEKEDENGTVFSASDGTKLLT